jgi:hypothetical protein
VAIREIAMSMRAVSGTIMAGSSDTTAGSAGSLDPAFAFWLMGFPRAFLDCAPPAMRSSRNSRRKSSARCAEAE